MTLFIKNSSTSEYQISDAYLMAISFIIFFLVGKVIRAVITKLKESKSKSINIANPKGGEINVKVIDDSAEVGSIEVQFSNDNELALTILSCISNEKNYLVKNPRIKELIFNLVKAKLKNEALVITPNMIRFLALKFLNNDSSVITTIGDFVFSSGNRARLYTRVIGAAVLGFVASVFSLFPYAILMTILYFDITENCAYKCHDHFQHLPKEGIPKIYVEKDTGHLIIAGTKEAREVEIYIPSIVPDKVITENSKEIRIEKKDSKSRKKAKEVQFSDFKKNDPILSSFKDLDEPDIPQKVCPINDPHNILDIKAD